MDAILLENHGKFTYDASDITIPVDGLYHISYSLIYRNQSVQRVSISGSIWVNDTNVNQTAKDNYTRWVHEESAGGGEVNNSSSVSQNTYLSLKAGDKISIYTNGIGVIGGRYNAISLWDSIMNIFNVAD